MGRFKKTIALAALAALTLVVYSSVLGGPFILDDEMYIVKNQQIRDISSLWPPSPRSLTFFTFALNFASGGLDPFGYHLFNVLVHIANSALVFFLVLFLCETDVMKENGGGRYALPMAVVASFLFAVHPAQTQAVSYVTQRLASLTAMFYLLSLVLYLKWRTAGGGWRAVFYAASVVCAFAAQFTKETGFTLAAAIVLTELAFFRASGSKARRAASLAPFVLAMAVVPAMVFGPELWPELWGEGAASGLSEVTRRHQMLDLELVSSHDYLVTQFRVMVTYWRLLVFPAGQNIDYDYPLFTSFFAPEVLVSAVLVAAVFILGVFFLAGRMRKRSGTSLLAGYGIMFFFIAISIESSIIPIADVIFEHRLYLPGAGSSIFAAACVMALYGAAQRRFGLSASALAWAVAAAVVLAVPLSAATWSRNGLWADEVLLWRDASAKSPHKARVRNNYGTALYKRGFKSEGMAEYREAVELEPVYADARYNLGNAYRDLGLMDEAIAEYEAAVKYQPGKLSARNNLGLSYMQAGRYEDAAGQFEAILRANPGDRRAMGNLSEARSMAGR